MLLMMLTNRRDVPAPPRRPCAGAGDPGAGEAEAAVDERQAHAAGGPEGLRGAEEDRHPHPAEEAAGAEGPASACGPMRFDV